MSPALRHRVSGAVFVRVPPPRLQIVTAELSPQALLVTKHNGPARLPRQARPRHATATPLARPPPPTEERPIVVRSSEPQTDRDPRPVPRIPPTGPVWRDPTDIARRRRHGVARDIIIEV